MRIKWTDTENWESILPKYDYVVQEWKDSTKIKHITIFSNLNKDLIVDNLKFVKGQIIFTTYPHSFIFMGEEKEKERFGRLEPSFSGATWFLYEKESDMMKDYFDILLKGKIFS